MLIYNKISQKYNYNIQKSHKIKCYLCGEVLHVGKKTIYSLERKEALNGGKGFHNKTSSCTGRPL